MSEAKQNANEGGNPHWHEIDPDPAFPSGPEQQQLSTVRDKKQKVFLSPASGRPHITIAPADTHTGMLRHALALAESGIPVFPCDPETKRP